MKQFEIQYKVEKLQDLLCDFSAFVVIRQIGEPRKTWALIRLSWLGMGRVLDPGLDGVLDDQRRGRWIETGQVKPFPSNRHLAVRLIA
jgi:hypothetical protein